MVEIEISESEDQLCIRITDDGIGMKEETLLAVANPFYTTRTTRKVGMGIPLFRFAAEQTGGNLQITSKHFEEYPEHHGTTVTALFFKKHIDFTPLGDIISTVTTLIQGHPAVDFLFTHSYGEKCVSLDTREIRAVLDDVPINTFEILLWIKDNLSEQYEEFNKN